MKKNKLLAALLLCMTVTFPLKAYSYDKVFSGTYDSINLPNQNGSVGYINAGESAIVQAGTIFTNNTAKNGILFNKGSLTVNENTLFKNNNAANLGGVIYTAAKTDINNSEFINNSTAGDGGAVYININNNMSDNQVNISNSNFEQNHAAGFGGAVFLSIGTVNIKNSTFNNNTAGFGGAVATTTSPYAELLVEDSSFTGNSALAIGAMGLFTKGTIKNTIFSNNSATDANDDGGGAMFLGSESKAYIDNVVFENNTSAIRGGAISTRTADGNNNSAAVLKISNSTFEGNVAATNGGAIDNYFYNENNFIQNTIFDGNKAANGGAIYNHGELDLKRNKAKLNVVNGSFVNNVATTGSGGAIYNAGVAAVDGSFTNNSAEHGGAIYNNTGATAIIGEGSVFNANTSVKGGGAIKNYTGADLTVKSGTQFISNTTQAGGGAIQNMGTAKLGDNLVFDGNKAKWGGAAVYGGSRAGVASVTNIGKNAVFTNNTLTNTGTDSDSVGGAIFIEDDEERGAKFTLDENAYFGNNSANHGGAIYLKQNTIAAKIGKGAIFENNTAAKHGGAIFTGTALSLDGATFKNNTAAENGGAIYTETAMAIKDSSFINNTASGKGGAIFANDDLKIAAVAKDVIFSGNTAASGSDIFMNKAGSTLTLNADEGKSIIVAGGIDGNRYNIKINDNNDNTISTFALRAPRAASPTGTVVINSPIQNATVNVTNGTLHLAQGSALTDTTITMTRDTTLNTVDNQINTFNRGVINLADNTNLIVDLDLGTGKADNYSNVVSSTANGIEVVAINPLGNNTTSNNVSVNILDAMGLDPNAGNVTISQVLQNQTQTVLTPIRYLQGSVSSNGLLTMAPTGNSYKDFNPAVMASSVAAQLGGYLTQLNSYDQAFRNMDMYMLMTKKQRQALKLRNKYAAADGNLVFSPLGTQYDDKAVWFRPYASFENVPLKNGPRVSNVAYGSFFGADSELYDLGHGWDGMLSVYAGYNGSHQAYDGISVYQNGGTLGLTGIAYKGNFFTGLTLNAGANAGEANTAYGHDNFSMLMAGIANKTGYNIELADGKFIIQPNLQLSYSFVNTFDYRNAAGVKINADPLHAIQVEPGIKFIGNLKNGWQPYAGISVVGNIMDQTNFRANNVSLPELSVKPYVRYGLGVRKTWGEICSGFLQTYFTNGGRNGVGLQAGFRFTLGKGGFDSIKANDKLPEKPKTTISLKGVK